MGAMSSYKRRKSNSERYGEKTSENGFYSPNPSKGFGGRNRDGSRWSTTYYQWNERPDTPKAAPAPANVAPPAPPAAPAFDDRLQKIQQANTANTDKLMEQMAADRKSYQDLTAKYEDSIKSYQNAFNQGSSVGGQESALMINPAQSEATKKKKTSKGTQQFNRNLKISNVKI